MHKHLSFVFFFKDSSDDECGIPKPPRDLPGRPKSAAVTRRLDFPGQKHFDLRGQDLAGILIVALQLQHGPAQRGGEAETADRPDFRPGGFLFFIFYQILLLSKFCRQPVKILN